MASTRSQAWLLAAVWLLSLAQLRLVAAADFYVSPAGQSSGDGSRERPWDLATALAHPPAVAPGDTLWLGGGTYRGTFSSRLQGTADKPIVVRQAPGERAVLDAFSSGSGGSTLLVYGGHTWFWGFEVTCSSPRRATQTGGSHPGDLGLNGSIDVHQGPGHKLINLVVHHCAGGPSAWLEAIDAEAYGCIVFNNGWDAPDRGHGHAFYWQNDQGTKRITDNIFFNQFSHGIHIYGSSRAYLNNFHVEGNIAFNNGAMSKRSGYTRNFLIGGGRKAENITLTDNCSYFSPPGGANVLGYGQGCGRLTMTGNYFAAVEGGTDIKADDLSLSGNTFAGRVHGIAAEEHPANTYHAAQRPSGLHVVIRPNRYEPGRAHIAVFNWDKKETVALDLSSSGLNPGDRYRVRDVQDYFGEPILSGRYQPGPVSVRLTGLTVADPVGEAPVKPSHTAPEFAALVVEKLQPAGQ